MEFSLVHTAAVMTALLFSGVAVFQVLLSFGLPFGEFTMGGYHKVLPKRLRIAAGFSAAVLLLMGFVFLQHARVVASGIPFFLPTAVLVWIITAYMAVNTVVNLASKSRKERLVMSPISGLTCILGLFIAFS
ncbi:hypothetical protein [Planococcus lenghuensis]|uniref:Uncharacterized protein n=1 Tax=Planococcus lenghuensis TaxID=2213202 RepID=A0A1Q2L317_9BACL|nr:hypothetical protein [Planococcus lenghuensis]AQQ54858.1 hypothetical protein B0X71_18290 [Planococcus lenghuensis]